MDVSRAEATVKSDRDRILDAIRSDVGDLNLMTHRLKNALVAGAVAQVPPAESEWTEDVDRELHIAARLSQLYGRLAEAEPLYRRALEGRQRVLGADHLLFHSRRIALAAKPARWPALPRTSRM